MIQDTDGLYLMEQRIIGADKISINYQTNDLSKPDTQQTTFSRAFTLPDNLAIRKLFESAEQLDSTSQIPYKLIPAFLIIGGELVFDGVAQLTGFSRGWEVVLKDEKASLFSRLDRSIKTVDLSRYDHKWSIEAMNQLATTTDGVCYPAVDYGLLSEGKLPADGLFPALYVKTLIGQLLNEEGFVLTGDLSANAMYKMLAIPFVESEPTSQDEDWRKERTSIVSWDPGNDDSVSRTIFGKAAWVDRIQPFNIDNQPRNGLSQGRMQNYDTTSFAYICDTSMRVQVQATQILKLKALTGSVEAALLVEKNGQEVGKAYISTGSGYNLLFMRTDQINLDTTVDCQAGDRLQIRLQVNRQTKTGAWGAEIYNNPDNARVSFTPKIELGTGGTWVVSRNLPEIKGLELLKNIAYLCSGTWEVNSSRQEIRLNWLSDTVNNIDNAIDWSRKIDESETESWVPLIDGYGIRNLLKWKDSDETKRSIDGSLLSIPYGDGLILTTTNTANVETTLFEMAFAATINSTGTIANYGTPLLIKTRTVSGSGENLQISKQNTAPRLILIHPTQTIGVPSTRIAADGETVEEVQVNLKACWFGTRPTSIKSPLTACCLCFSDVSGNQGEISLIDTYYDGLLQVLRRPTVLTIGVMLTSVDMHKLDFSRPIRLQRISIGGLAIADSFWYLNKVSDYGADGRAKVTLIGF